MNAGGKFSSSAYKRRSNQILELTQDLRRAKEMEASMRHEGTAYQPADTSEVESKYIAESEKLQQMNTRLGLSYDALKAKIASLNKRPSYICYRCSWRKNQGNSAWNESDE